MNKANCPRVAFDFNYHPNRELPGSVIDQLHGAGPVVWNETLSAWMVSGYDEAKKCLNDVSRFTMEGTPVATVFTSQSMLVTDTPLHHAMRAVWSRQTSATAVAEQARKLQSLAIDAMRGVQPLLESGESIDLVPVIQSFLLAYVEISFGIAKHSMPVYEKWVKVHLDAPAIPQSGESAEYDQYVADRNAVIEVIQVAIAARVSARDGGDGGEAARDLTGAMASAIGRPGITEAVAVDNLFNFSTGSFGTTEKWIAAVVARICSDPQARDRLKAKHGLIDAFANEVMRLDTVAQAVMRLVRPGGAQLSGIHLEAGDPVYIMLGAANRDPSAFVDPDSFQVDRPAKPHMGFGFGFHHCLGVNIARQEASAFIGALLREFETLEVVEVDLGTGWALLGPRKLMVRLA